jgi:hypothetical protein
MTQRIFLWKQKAEVIGSLESNNISTDNVSMNQNLSTDMNKQLQAQNMKPTFLLQWYLALQKSTLEVKLSGFSPPERDFI